MPGLDTQPITSVFAADEEDTGDYQPQTTDTLRDVYNWTTEDIIRFQAGMNTTAGQARRLPAHNPYVQERTPVYDELNKKEKLKLY